MCFEVRISLSLLLTLLVFWDEGSGLARVPKWGGTLTFGGEVLSKRFVMSSAFNFHAISSIVLPSPLKNVHQFCSICTTGPIPNRGGSGLPVATPFGESVHFRLCYYICAFHLHFLQSTCDPWVHPKSKRVLNRLPTVTLLLLVLFYAFYYYISSFIFPLFSLF